MGNRDEGRSAVKFILEISLDNAEARDDESENVRPDVLASYLRKVADRCEDNMTMAGTVMDGNGNNIGTYRTEGD